MPESVRLIKKYPNRRLYDTKTSAYITLSDVKELVLANEVFRVLDAKKGDDLTRSILLQIIVEEESAGTEPLLGADLLIQLIRLYGHGMQRMLGKSFELSLQSLSGMQSGMKHHESTAHFPGQVSEEARKLNHSGQ